MTIAPLPQGTTTFYGLTGIPLSGGKIFTYTAGTSTPKATWQDPQQAALNANPILLNANGQAVIYGWGAYRLLVEDSSGNTISDSITYGGPLTQTTQVFANSGSFTFTVPVGVYSVYAEAVGAGGGGGNCSASGATGNVSGAGGGAGGFASGNFTVTPGQTITVVVGSVGAVGAQQSGTVSNFGSLLTAHGGGGPSNPATGTSIGGLGGVASGGTVFNFTGGAGTDGMHIPGSGGAPYIGPGNGGSSYYGQGGTSVNGAQGNTATTPGSGGGGAMDVNLTGAVFHGGAGAPGLVLVSYWS